MSSPIDFLAALSAVLLSATNVLPQKTPDVRLNAGSLPGTGSALDPQIAAVGSSVHVAWLDSRNGQREVFYNRSLDGGATWLANDRRLDALALAATTSTNEIHIAASGAAVYAICVVGRDVLFDRSLDDGLTWLPQATRLDVGSPLGTADAYDPRMAASGAAVYVTWTDYRNGPGSDIYCNRSSDRGTTWLPTDVRLNDGSPGGHLPGHAQIAAAGTAVYVVWQEDRSSLLGSNHDIYFNRSLDGGLTWLAADQRLNVGRAPATGDSYGPSIACSRSLVDVVWTDDRNGLPDIYCNRSLDAGATWLATDLRLDAGSTPGSAASGSPRIAAVDNSVFVSWEDSRNGAADVYFNRSWDRGATWLATDLRLDTGSPPGASAALQHQLAAAGSSVYAVWADTRNSSLPSTPADIYANRSLDAGTTWLPTDLRLDLGSPPGFGASYEPQLALAGASAYVTWREFRGTSHPDAWFNLASGYQPYGVATAGSGGRLPRLLGESTAAIGGTVVCEFRDGLGASLGVLAAGFGTSSQVAMPLLGGTLLVAPATTLWVLLTGPAGIAGAGSAALSVPLPYNTILLGQNLNLQGLFLDAGAVGGMSMTRALAIWIG